MLSGPAEVLCWAGELRDAGKTLVTVNGVFDIFHAGHLALLAEARTLGDALLVLVNSDTSVRQIKGPDRPINNEQNRLAILRALRCVDAALLFDEDVPHASLSLAKPHIHVKGSNANQVHATQERALVESWGGKLISLPLVPGLSSTRLLERLHSAA